MDWFLLRCASTEPLWQRFKRQEGALLVIVASTLFFQGQRWLPALGTLGLTLLVLSSLYLLNDLVDCVADRDNPRKHQPYIQVLIHWGQVMWGVLVAQKALTLWLAWFFGGEKTLGVVVLIFVMNTAYSYALKKVPLLDVIWVGLWGASIAALGGLDQPWASFALVALMTAISHVYQIRLDAAADAHSGIQTSEVRSPALTSLLIVGLCSGLGLVLSLQVHPVLGLSAAIPFLFAKFLESNQAWVLARYYFAVIWCVHLESFYGRF